MSDRKISSVFLELWQFRLKYGQGCTEEEFVQYAETWMRIRDLEKAPVPMIPSFWTADAEEVPSVTTAASTAEAPEPKPKKSHDRTTGEGHGVTAQAVKKRAALGALAKARASGSSTADIAEAAELTLTEVMDLNDGKKMPAQTWAQLEKGLRKLGFPPGGNESVKAQELPPAAE